MELEFAEAHVRIERAQQVELTNFALKSTIATLEETVQNQKLIMESQRTVSAIWDKNSKENKGLVPLILRTMDSFPTSLSVQSEGNLALLQLITQEDAVRVMLEIGVVSLLLTGLENHPKELHLQISASRIFLKLTVVTK